MSGSDTVQSVERAIDLLQTLASSDNGLRLSDLAEQLELNTTTAHNLIRTLVSRGFVVKGARQRLQLGPALVEILSQEQERNLLRAAATASLELQRAFPDSIIIFAEMVGPEVRARIRLSPDRPGLLQRPGNIVSNLYGTAVGLCCQAFADLASLQALHETQPFHEFAATLWDSPEILSDFLDSARQHGFVETPFTKQERPRLAVPVFRGDGQLVATIGIALPAIDDDSRRKAVQALNRAAAALSILDDPRILRFARTAVHTAAERTNLAHYTGILSLQGLERLVFLHKAPADLELLRAELTRFLDGQRKWKANFSNYWVGGNATAAALYHGILPEARESVAAEAEAFLQAPRDRAGLVCHPKNPGEEKVWIDAAWAVAPFALHAGLALGRSELIDEACHQTLGMIALLRNPDNGLLHQSRGFVGPNQLSTDHWSRGNGWGLMALSALAEDLPATHPRYDEARKAFAELVAACLHVQGPSGLWHQELPRHDSFVETSGSGLILYAIGVAIAQGIAPDGARVALERGLTAYTNYIAIDGSVFHTCTGCLSPGDGSPEAYMAHTHAKDDPHAFGPIILAYAQAASLGITDIGVSL